MESADVLKTYEDTHALLKGHFRLSSGRHSDRYLQSAMVLQYPWIAEKFCAALADQVRPLGAQLVLSPAMGGLFVGHELARALKVKSIFTERNKETDAMELRRGFTVQKGDKFFAVEDIITTAKSIKESIKVLEDMGAVLVGAGCLIDRTGGEAQKLFNVPVKALASLKVESWEEADCPLCKQGIPVTKPGSRAKF
ncbi:MAG TPA: orotate phosphoribosyltransferase [bacterium]|jgi:orotate phosphoribosyltransferase|nr:orotate phosphoribosyltransferase [bacterium]